MERTLIKFGCFWRKISRKDGCRGVFESAQEVPGRRNFAVNLHASGSGRTTAYESLAGALGIPEYMPAVWRRDFHSTPMPRLRAPVFAQLSAGALSFHSKSLHRDESPRWFVTEQYGFGVKALFTGRNCSAQDFALAAKSVRIRGSWRESIGENPAHFLFAQGEKM